MDENSAIVFISFCVFIPMLIPLLCIQNKPIYIQKEIVRYIYKEKNKPEVKQIIVKKDDKLFQDCVQCLNSLGLTKKQAKEKADKMFLKKDYKSIEDFLLDAYKID